MMEYVVSLLIIAFCLYLVVPPLLKPKVKTAEIKEEMDEMTIKNVYATLNELEMDFNMQKLSEEDYTKLKAQYERIAAELIAKEKKAAEKKAKASNEQVKDIEAEIEEELALLRKERGEK